MPDNILRTACLAWQSGKKSMAVKKPQQKKELARLSGECMQFVMTGAGTGLKTNVRALLDGLEANIRSSSHLGGEFGNQKQSQLLPGTGDTGGFDNARLPYQPQAGDKGQIQGHIPL